MIRLTMMDEDLASLEALVGAPVSGGAPQQAALASRVEMAWHLRQRDPLATYATLPDLRKALMELAEPVRLPLLARLMLVEAEIDLQCSRLQSASQCAKGAHELFESVGDHVGIADALHVSAQAEYDSGARAESLLTLSAAAVHARVAGDDSRAQVYEATEAVFSSTSGVESVHVRWGRMMGSLRDAVPDTAPKSMEQAAERRESADRLLACALAHDYLGVMALSRGDNQACVELLQAAVEFYRRLGQERRATVCSCNLAGSLSNMVDHEGALEHLSDAIERARPRGVARHLGILLIQSAHTLHLLGKLQAARDQIQEAKSLLEGLEKIPSYGVLLQVQGDIEFGSGRMEEALASYRAQEEHALTIGSSIHQVLALRQQVEVLAALGWNDRALEIGRSALTLVRMHSNTLVESEVLAAIGMVFAEEDAQPPEGSAHPGAQLHWLHEALDASRRSGKLTVGNQLLSQLARAYARRGLFEQAYDYACQAAVAREQEQSERSSNRAAAMAVRHRTERSRALAEHHARLAQEQSERAEELARTGDTLAMLGILGRELTTHLDDQRIFEALNRHVGALMEVASFLVFLLDDSGSQLELAFGVEKARALHAEPVRLDDPLAGSAQCARTREDVYLSRDDVEIDTRQHIPGTLYTRSALYTPLLVGGRLLGVMTLQSERPAAYGPHERLILRTLGAYCAIALENSQAYRRLAQANAHLSELSLTDTLTGLRNRRFVQQQLDADVALSLRAFEDCKPALPEAADLVFYLIDIDHFKRINDEHGHSGGDAVLSQLRDRLRSVCRDGDYLVRWGGEEILLVARQTNRRHALSVGNRIREAINVKPFPVQSGELLVTASVGIAAFPQNPAAPREGTWQAVLELADGALYRAKALGRNRVCVAEG